MARKVYFRDGPLSVTSEFVRGRNRSIQLSTLESVEISRKLFFAALALCGGMIGFVLVFGDLLYPHEMALLGGVGAGALFLAWNVGTFTIYSKLTGARGWSVTWWIGPLLRMRDAVELALEEREAAARARRKRGGVAQAEDDEEDEDAEADV